MDFSTKMKPTLEEIIPLIKAYGWVDLGQQRNPYMVSFVHEEYGDRMNVYFTTMTITVQPKSGGSCDTYKNVSMDFLEWYLIKHNK